MRCRAYVWVGGVGGGGLSNTTVTVVMWGEGGGGGHLCLDVEIVDHIPESDACFAD
jgi:hypothetical protein